MEPFIDSLESLDFDKSVEGLYDPTDVEGGDSTLSAVSSPGSVTNIEQRSLAIPSTTPSNQDLHRGIELQIRIESATQHIYALRELIAERSFQYSHVIRPAPRKGVRTRARSTLSKLSHSVSFHCIAYRRCRAAMERLGATPDILNQYQLIQAEDIKTSTALLDPNKPGSTTLRLSWIWQLDSLEPHSSVGALQECALLPFNAAIVQ